MDAYWTDLFTAFGLALTGIGAFVAARAVILKKEDALKIGSGALVSHIPEENLELPMVKNLLSSSWGAQRGLWLVVVGTSLQIIPVVLRLIKI
jgi:hypothetical protein